MSQNEDINVKVRATVDEMVTPMNKAADSVQDFTEKSKGYFGKLGDIFDGFLNKISGFGAAFGVGLAGVGVAIVGMVKHSIDAADHINDLSISTGASTEALSQLGYAAELSGSNLDTMASGLQTSSKNIALAAQGTGRAQQAIKDLGLEATNLVKLKPEDQLMVIADAMNNVENPSKRAAIASKIFGGAADDMLRIINGGSQPLREMMKEADDLGKTLTEKTGKGADELNDKIASLQGRFGGFILSITNLVVPAINELIDRVAILRGTFAGVSVARLGEELGTISEKIQNVNRHIAEAKQNGGFGSDAIIESGEKLKKKLEADYNATADAYKAAQIRKQAAEKTPPKGEVGTEVGDDNPPAKPPATTNPPAKPTSSGASGSNADAERWAKDQQKEKDEIAALDVERKHMVATQEIEIERDKNKELLELDRIDKSEYLRRELQSVQQINEIDEKAAQDKIDAIKNDVVARERAENEKIAIIQRAARQEQQIRHQIILEEQKERAELARSINASLENTVAGFLDGSKSMKDAFKDFAQSVVSDIARMNARNLITSVFGGTSGGPGGIGGMISGILGGSIGGFFGGGGGVSQDGLNVGQQYDWGFPSFAVGSWSLPSDMIANVHKGEMIIPAREAESIRSGGGLGGQTINMVVNTPDAASFRRNQGQIMADMQAALNRARRNN